MSSNEESDDDIPSPIQTRKDKNKAIRLIHQRKRAQRKQYTKRAEQNPPRQPRRRKRKRNHLPFHIVSSSSDVPPSEWEALTNLQEELSEDFMCACVQHGICDHEHLERHEISVVTQRCYHTRAPMVYDNTLSCRTTDVSDTKDPTKHRRVVFFSAARNILSEILRGHIRL